MPRKPALIRFYTGQLASLCCGKGRYRRWARSEFFEFVIDAPGEVEGIWESGDLYFQTASPIPDIVSPGSVCVLGLHGVFLVRRSRSRVRVA